MKKRVFRCPWTIRLPNGGVFPKGEHVVDDAESIVLLSKAIGVQDVTEETVAGAMRNVERNEKLLAELGVEAEEKKTRRPRKTPEEKAEEARVKAEKKAKREADLAKKAAIKKAKVEEKLKKAAEAEKSAPTK